MTPTTRYLCPLGCGWHHDREQLSPTMPPPGASIDDHVCALLMADAMLAEAAVREHFESHPLIEWAAALRDARQERDDLQARIDSVDWLALHAAAAAHEAEQQRYNWHNIGRCPMCGEPVDGGWVCEADMVEVRGMKGPERRRWSRFERPRGLPIQGSGYTAADLLGVPLRTPATGGEQQ